MFRQGGFGDDPKSAIRFKVALTRAEIIVRVADKAPLRIIKKSVKRTAHSQTGTRTVKAKQETTLAGRIKASISKTPTIAAEGEASGTRSTLSEAEIQEAVSRHFEQHFTTEDGHIGWEVEADPQFSTHLSGSPWNAADAPRMNLGKSSNRNADGDPPSIIVEIRCCREDIEIIDLRRKIS